MKCPIDETDLVMTERQGVEIDYCPKCRGVWLDRGELDKIIERATPSQQPVPPQPPQPRHPPQQQYGHGDNREYGDRRDPNYKRKKKSFLGEIFDF
ncbi:hypothetical protein JSE7799_03700 [Jannaschia seosinensis]|uniref:Transcription factor zinc-finger domain-containing protein n=1 Tax=Jannaschia seosinensis TaxID=313367 RepID=A0A0M7BFK7_9RHOB|nr:zf-TFIIB domain-containing protein [Jannaschia seosinensis]CUH40959.1 hypothetical protein JSE7799_03700 [Jannaschia seosinensis]